jgi:hypothetical protein
MDNSVALQSVLGTTTVEPHEAVAIVQQLIGDSRDDGEDDGHPLTPDRLTLSRDGSVRLVEHAAVTQVALADLMQQLLPHGVVKAPAALRYAIARARGEVAAPAFDSLSTMGSVLERFERGDRRSTIRGLVQRADPPQPAAESAGDRRRHGPAVADLRREIRRADQELFAHRVALAQRPSPTVESAAVTPPRAPDRVWRTRAALVAVAVILLSFAAGYGLTTGWHRWARARHPALLTSPPVSDFRQAIPLSAIDRPER